MNTNRRNFLASIGGVAAATALGGCKTGGIGFNCGCRTYQGNRLKFGVIGAGGKGWTDWRNMMWHGEVPVAICDVDRREIDKSLAAISAKGFKADSVRTYTDYRKMIDDQSKLGMDFVTISTPDHMHAPQAIAAMRCGIHCYVQKPLVRTLWENEYILKVAKETGAIVQMGNQGSSGDGHRRHVEIIQQGIIGDVREIYVWTDRPIWFQGDLAKKFASGRAVQPPKELDWDCWLGTAKWRDYPENQPDGLKLPCKNQWASRLKGVYHSFNWRAFYDFGTGAFGDMACHTMNLPYRAAELGAVKSAECYDMHEWNDTAFPVKSRVKLVYAARDSKARPGVRLPECTIYWSEGGFVPEDERLAPIMKVLRAKEKGEDPLNGCIFIGSKGMMASLDPYGNDCILMLNGEKEPRNTKVHEACAVDQIPMYLPRVPGKTDDIWTDMDREHTGELCRAIRGQAKCFSDIDYSTGILEGMLVGCMSQRLNRKLSWSAEKKTFDDKDANALIRPYVRPGWEF